MLHVPFLKSIMPDWEAMKAVTSVCLLFSTTALVLIRLNIYSILRKILIGILASLILLVSVLTIYDYLRIIADRTGSNFHRIY